MGKLQERISQELHNYGAWLLHNLDAEPLERRSEKNRRANYILSETLKEAVKVIEGENEEPDAIQLEAREFWEWHKWGIKSAITAVEGLAPTKTDKQ